MKMMVSLAVVLAVSAVSASVPDAVLSRFHAEMTRSNWLTSAHGHMTGVQISGQGGLAQLLLDYAVNNGMSTNDVALLTQSLITREYESYKKLSESQKKEQHARISNWEVLFTVLKYARDPASLDFLDAMRREQPSPFQSQAGYVFMQILGNLPVAAIRAYLSDPEKAARVDMNGLCLMVDDKNRGSRASGKQGSEDVDDIYAFLLEHISNIEDVRRLLSLDRRLSGRYPEYKTSAQRLVVHEKGKNYEPPADWDDESKKPALAQKAELAELAKTPPEILTDMRQRFKNLPAPAAAEKEE